MNQGSQPDSPCCAHSPGPGWPIPPPAHPLPRSHGELLNTRSITTIGQQTHHVALLPGQGPPQPLQVGTAALVQHDVLLPDGRGVLHVTDSVMCCLRLLQHCRYEQVWNKTVRPSPKVALQGAWNPQVDELHAILIHCDSWQPLFQGLRGAIVPLVGGERNAKAFADSTVHFHELLILEKPPEMSKKKRKPKGAEPTVAGVPLTATPVLEAQESSEAVNAQLAASAMEQRAQDTAVAAAARAASDPSLAVAAAANTETALAVVKPESIHPTANYRMMFSLYRKDSDAPPPAEGTQCSGRHLTFCMAPEDILIRNSFHMLSETEKARRRNSAQFCATRRNSAHFGAIL